MEDTGEQLHPNWRALATIHIPLKRFVKEGTKDVLNGTHNSFEKYKILNMEGNEIKEFYQELVVTKDDHTQNLLKKAESKITRKSCRMKKPIQCELFEAKKFFRFAMENKVDELKKMNFENQNLNACDSYGWTALMMASCEGAYEAAKFLLTIGVDRYIKDRSGRTAKDLANVKGHWNIVDLLNIGHKELVEDIQEKVYQPHEPFYCEICKQSFEESSKRQHYTSTVHQFLMKSNIPANKIQKFNISNRNKGLQLMVKQGWNKESGLGPSESGRLYPVKTVIRKQRTGLGIEQDVARVTHFKSYDLRSVVRNSPHCYKKNTRNRNEIKREKLRDRKRERRLRNELN